MTFSKEARRLAAAARGVLSGRTDDQIEKDRKPPPSAVDGAPLDRRRHVKFSLMDETELLRAEEQAKARIERTKPSADQDRYKKQLKDVRAEILKREGAPLEAPPSQPPPLQVENIEPDDTPPRFAPHPLDTPSIDD